jgi:hypothetical protein
MRIVLISLGCCAVLSALAATAATAAPTRAATLTPAEQKGVKPLLNVYNVMNAELHVVVAEEESKNALLAGSGKANTALTKTLEEFVACAGAVKKVGKLPTARMSSFVAALNSSCSHLQAGANDVAKAIGAVGKGNTTSAKSELVASLTEFKKGSAFLASAEKRLVQIGGSSALDA